MDGAWSRRRLMQALTDLIRNNEIGAAEYLDKYIAIH